MVAFYAHVCTLCSGEYIYLDSVEMTKHSMHLVYIPKLIFIPIYCRLPSLYLYVSLFLCVSFFLFICCYCCCCSYYCGDGCLSQNAFALAIHTQQYSIFIQRHCSIYFALFYRNNIVIKFPFLFI